MFLGELGMLSNYLNFISQALKKNMHILSTKWKRCLSLVLFLKVISQRFSWQTIKHIFTIRLISLQKRVPNKMCILLFMESTLLNTIYKESCGEPPWMRIQRRFRLYQLSHGAEPWSHSLERVNLFPWKDHWWKEMCVLKCGLWTKDIIESYWKIIEHTRLLAESIVFCHAE